MAGFYLHAYIALVISSSGTFCPTASCISISRRKSQRELGTNTVGIITTEISEHGAPEG
jgi:hypothetical protein